MLKLVGAALLTLGGWGIGCLLAAQERRRVTEIEAILDFLRYIRVQIMTFCRPRGELFASYHNEFLETVGFSERLRTTGRITEALSAPLLSGDKEMRAWLTAFDAELGTSYTEGQIAACDFYIARVEEHLAARREEMPTRTRVRRTVSLVAAVMVALLLL